VGGTVFAAAAVGLPGLEGGGEALDDEVVEEGGGDEGGEEGLPGCDEGEERGWVVRVPVVDYGAADGGEPERVEHGFVGGCGFAGWFCVGGAILQGEFCVCGSRFDAEDMGKTLEVGNEVEWFLEG